MRKHPCAGSYCWLRTHARGEICAARLGGEEFALLAGTETLDPAIALQLLGEIAAADMPHGEAITASIGVAEARVTAGEDWTALYGQADRALYRAKNEGRNQVRDSRDPTVPRHGSHAAAARAGTG